MADEQVVTQGGGYRQKILLGFLFLAASVVCLWYGSPARTGGDPLMVFVWAFTMLFALGFIFTSMGLMGADRDYPAFVSGLVLYFIVGALVAVFLYVSGNDLGLLTLSDADNPSFWFHWLRVLAMWPFELAVRAELLGYMSLF